MAMSASISSPSEDGPAGAVAYALPAVFEETTGAPVVSNVASIVTAEVTGWTHTLILTGELDRRSAHALEAEIEHLCDEGVTGIRLDLRELTYIDSVGVAVIAFRCRLCRKRGFDFALISGSRLIRRAFEQAGVTDLLGDAPDHEEPSMQDRRPRTGVSSDR